MSYFKGRYLRVTTPITTNGISPLLVNGVVQTEETFLPLSARKELEKKNRRLMKSAPHLVMKIEVVGGEPAVQPEPQASVAKKPAKAAKTATEEV
jgi:hypothetical protein